MAAIPKLSENDWDELLDKLVLRASWKFYRLGWSTREDAGPGGIDPQSIALDTIISVIEGKRQYNEKVYPDFYSFLQSALDSQIWHLYEKIYQRDVKVLSISQKENEDGSSKGIEFESKEPDPVQICVTKEVANKAKEILLREFVGDKIVIEILECLRAGFTKRTEIAEVLGVKVEDIDNAKKRLKRTVDKKLQNLKMETRNEK